MDSACGRFSTRPIIDRTMEYLINDVLYTGSETLVVRASGHEGEAKVVLKLARDEAPAAHLVAKLRHEHAMLESLAIDGVIRTLGVVPHRQSIALVLEDWGTMSLGRALSQAPLPLDAALRLGARLARVLGQVHRRG